MNLQRQNSRYYSQVGDFYHDYNSHISKHLDSISQLLQNSYHLDLGCGELPFSQFYKKNNILFESADIVQNLSNTVDHILPKTWSSLPFKTSSYSSTAMFDVIEHLPDDLLALKEVHRILKPNGYLILTIPFLYRLHEFPYDYRRYTYTGILKLLDDCNFAPIFVHPIGSPSSVIRIMSRESTLLNSSNPLKTFTNRALRRLLIHLPEIFATDYYTCFGFFILAKAR